MLARLTFSGVVARFPNDHSLIVDQSVATFELTVDACTSSVVILPEFFDGRLKVSGPSISVLLTLGVVKEVLIAVLLILVNSLHGR